MGGFFRRAVAVAFVFTMFTPLFAQTNSWTSATSGNWHDLSWSLGSRPAPAHSIFITNANSKAVGLNGTTRDIYPSSLIVSNVVIGNSGSSTNTLLLNFMGNSVPFCVSNSVVVEQNGALLNMFSKFIVGRPGQGSTRLNGGVISQEGGSNLLHGSTYIDALGRYSLVNGTTKTEFLYLGSFGGGAFVQSGGRHENQSTSLGNALYSGQYELSGGDLLSSFFFVNVGFFHQTGGNSQFGSFDVTSVHSFPNAFLDNGTLTANFVRIGGGSNGAMRQNGGTVYAPDFRVVGDSYRYYASYELNGGTVFAGNFERGIGASARQTGGFLLVTNTLNGGLSQNGGRLLCQNYVASDPVFPITLDHTAGTNVVTNTFTIGGSYAVTYKLEGGSLLCSNLHVLDSGTLEHRGGEIQQGGELRLSGKLFVESGSGQFGKLTVVDTADLFFASAPYTLRFKASSDRVWGGTLQIRDWIGSTNGGGTHQIYFGTNANSLTSSQLGQIRFLNPSGLPPAEYFGKLLPTGELVPTRSVPIGFQWSGAKLILNWPHQGFTLESATNVFGPYNEVIGASSPWTNYFQDPNRFFRVVKK